MRLSWSMHPKISLKESPPPYTFSLGPRVQLATVQSGSNCLIWMCVGGLKRVFLFLRTPFAPPFLIQGCAQSSTSLFLSPALTTTSRLMTSYEHSAMECSGDVTVFQSAHCCWLNGNLRVTLQQCAADLTYYTNVAEEIGLLDIKFIYDGWVRRSSAQSYCSWVCDM